MSRRRRRFSTSRTRDRGSKAPTTTSGAVANSSSAQRFADTAVEASCLAAVSIVPLYFSQLTASPFQTDKSTILITLSCIAAGAWSFGTLRRRVRGSSIRAVNPLIWLGVLVFLAYAIATISSIDPSLSLRGSIDRHQGLESYAAYAVFFICAATRLRHRAQMERLVTTVIVSSFAAVIFGFLQQLGIDPSPALPSSDPTVTQWPVRSSFGNHILFGGYLVMVIPLTVARVVVTYRRKAFAEASGQKGAAAFLVCFVGIPVSFIVLLVVARSAPGVTVLFPLAFAGYALACIAFCGPPQSAKAWRVQIIAYSGLLVLQSCVLVFTSARGPVFGALAALCTLGFLAGRKIGWRRIERAFLLIVLFGCGAIVALNVPNGPLQGLRSVTGIGHITNMLSTSSPDSSVQGRLEIWRGVFDLITTHPAVGSSWGGIGRDVVGYGPDTFRFAFDTVFPLKLRRETAENFYVDRAHDVYLDIIVTAGVVALLAFLATALAFFWFIRRAMKRIQGDFVWILIGVASAVVGHLVEGVFGIETAATLLLYWLFLGICAGSQKLDIIEETPAPMSPAASTIAGVYWMAVTACVLVFSVAAQGIPGPHFLATAWLLGSVAAVGVLSVALRQRPTPAAARDQTRKQVGSPKPSHWPMKIGSGLVLLAVLAGLSSQWRSEAAAYAAFRGSNSFVVGNLAAGLSDAELAANEASYESSYRNDLGLAYLSLARLQTNSSQLLSLLGNPDPASVDPATALLLNRNELVHLGLQEMRSAASLAPLDPAAWEALGSAYFRLQRAKLAIEAYSFCIQLSPDDPKCVADESVARVEMKEPRIGLNLANTAVALDPLYWYARYALAVVLDALHDPGDARQQAIRALGLLAITRTPPSADQMLKLRQLAKKG
jgi:O-antigen ligase/tetratricopeptide (TPR) repeat protein